MLEKSEKELEKGWRKNEKTNVSAKKFRNKKITKMGKMVSNTDKAINNKGDTTSNLITFKWDFVAILKNNILETWRLQPGVAGQK